MWGVRGHVGVRGHMTFHGGGQGGVEFGIHRGSEVTRGVRGHVGGQRSHGGSEVMWGLEVT